MVRGRGGANDGEEPASLQLGRAVKAGDREMSKWPSERSVLAL